MWLAEADIPLVKVGDRLAAGNCDAILVRKTCTVYLHTDVVIKKRECRSSAHSRCGPSCLKMRCKELKFLNALSGDHTPRLLDVYAEHDDDGHIDIVTVQQRATPLLRPVGPQQVIEILELTRSIGELGVVHGDIRIDNIVQDADDGRVQFIDWECSVRMGEDDALEDMGAPRADFTPSDWRDVDAHAAISLCTDLLRDYKTLCGLD